MKLSEDRNVFDLTHSNYYLFTYYNKRHTAFLFVQKVIKCINEKNYGNSTSRRHIIIM